MGRKGGLNGYGEEKKFLPTTEVQTRTVQPVARSNTDYEIPNTVDVPFVEKMNE